jgi:hypothetical protein
VKNFFGETIIGAAGRNQGGASDSSSDNASGERSIANTSNPNVTDFFGGSSTTGSKLGIGGGGQRQQKVAEMVKKLELDLKKKIGNNFNSVRKAWLEIDEKHVGYITAEEIAKFLGASG